MGYGTRAIVDTIREIASGNVSGSYAAVGTPLADHVRLICFNNGMDQDLYISLDGTNDNFRIASNGFKLLDISANKIRDDGLFFPIGTQIYVKEVSASVSSGDFWVEVIYADGGK